MIKVELRLEEPLADHMNEFELVVEYQHGDSDGQSEATHHYPESTVVELGLDALLLISVARMGGCMEECESFVASLIASQLPELEEDDHTDILEEWKDKFYTVDLATAGHDERPAAIVGYRLFFYNDDGHKFKVDTYLNDGKVE